MLCVQYWLLIVHIAHIALISIYCTRCPKLYKILQNCTRNCNGLVCRSSDAGRSSDGGRRQAGGGRQPLLQPGGPAWALGRRLHRATVTDLLTKPPPKDAFLALRIVRKRLVGL